MYWVVLSVVLLVESWTVFIIGWYIRTSGTGRQQLANRAINLGFPSIAGSVSFLCATWSFPKPKEHDCFTKTMSTHS